LARDNEEVGVIIFTGEGAEAFCSGGDISVRGDDGYLGEDKLAKKGIGRLNVFRVFRYKFVAHLSQSLQWSPVGQLVEDMFFMLCAIYRLQLTMQSLVRQVQWLVL